MLDILNNNNNHIYWCYTVPCPLDAAKGYATDVRVKVKMSRRVIFITKTYILVICARKGEKQHFLVVSSVKNNSS